MFTAIHLDALLLASSIPLVPPVPPRTAERQPLYQQANPTDTPTHTRNNQ